jgi:enediyne biosynthesis protein E4
MKRVSTARILVTVFFIGLLSVPLVVRYFSARSKVTQTSEQAALARYGFALREVSHAAGIDFVHQAPTLDAKLNGIMPEVASMGA